MGVAGHVPCGRNSSLRVTEAEEVPPELEAAARQEPAAKKDPSAWSFLGPPAAPAAEAGDAEEPLRYSEDEHAAAKNEHEDEEDEHAAKSQREDDKSEREDESAQAQEFISYGDEYADEAKNNRPFTVFNRHSVSSDRARSRSRSRPTSKTPEEGPKSAAQSAAQ